MQKLTPSALSSTSPTPIGGSVGSIWLFGSSVRMAQAAVSEGVEEMPSC
jgi:hypothetical protein